MTHLLALILVLAWSAPAFSLTTEEVGRVMDTHYPNHRAAYSVTGKTINWLIWQGPGSPPTYAQVDALVSSTPTPDVQGLKAWLKANMSFALRNSVHKAYPTFCTDLDGRQWADFQAGVLEAKAGVPLTNGQWAAFKNAVTTYKIPVTLP